MGQYFQYFHLGVDFELVITNIALIQIYSCKSKPSARIDRRVLHPQTFDFETLQIQQMLSLAFIYKQKLKSHVVQLKNLLIDKLTY